jgi:hypothetical protein
LVTLDGGRFLSEVERRGEERTREQRGESAWCRVVCITDSSISLWARVG